MKTVVNVGGLWELKSYALVQIQEPAFDLMSSLFRQCFYIVATYDKLELAIAEKEDKPNPHHFIVIQVCGNF